MAKVRKTVYKEKLNRITPLAGIGIFLLCAVALVYLYPLFWMADSSFRPAVDIFQFLTEDGSTF